MEIRWERALSSRRSSATGRRARSSPRPTLVSVLLDGSCSSSSMVRRRRMLSGCASVGTLLSSGTGLISLLSPSLGCKRSFLVRWALDVEAVHSFFRSIALISPFICFTSLVFHVTDLSVVFYWCCIYGSVLGCLSTYYCLLHTVFES